jgi:DNA gyrase subunit A
MVVTVTHRGYVKRTALSDYRAQRRGGKGVTGMDTRDKDFVADLFVASTHQQVLFLTSRGRAFVKKVYEVPLTGRASKGKALVNFIPVEADEKVAAVLPLPEFQEDHYLITATRLGYVKKTDLMAYANIRSSGLIAFALAEEDELIGVDITDGSQEVLLGTQKGMSIRFPEEQVRPMGRGTRGVKGIDLRDDDAVVGMAVVRDGGPDSVLIVGGGGFGKLTPVEEYRTQNRGGLGLMTFKITDRTGPVVALRLVRTEDQLMLVTSAGKVIRTQVEGIRITGRVAQGVCLVRLGEEEFVVSVERLAEPDEDPEPLPDGEAEEPIQQAPEES